MKETAYDLLEALDGIVILKVVGVGDLSWGPLSLVVGVVDHWSVPLALESGIGLHWPLPLTTPRSIGTLGVRNGWGNPVTILFVIPLLRFFRFRVRDSLRFIIEPALGLDGILVNDFVRSVLVPVIRLCGKLDRRTAMLWLVSTFVAVGSEILLASTQSAGFVSSESSISLGGLTGGLKSVSRLPVWGLALSMLTE